MSFLQQSLWVLAGQIVANGLNLLAGVVFARTLGPDSMGRFEFFRAVEVIAVTFTSMGIGNASIYFLNRERTAVELIVTNGVKAALCCAAALGCALVVVVRHLPALFGAVSGCTAVAFSMAAACLLCNTSIVPVLVAQLKGRRVAACAISSRLALFSLGSLFWMIGSLTFASAITALAMAECTGLVTVIVFLRSYIRPRTAFQWSLFRRLTRYGVRLAAANIVQVITPGISLGILRLLLPGDFIAIGLYTRAVAVSGWILMICSAFGPLFYARWAAISGVSRRNQSEMAIRICIALALAGVAVLGLLGRQLISALYGHAYAPASKALLILSVSAVPVSVYTVCNNLVAAAGRAHLAVWLLSLNLIVLAAAAVVLIPHFGTEGSALGVLIGNTATALASICLCRRLYGLRPGRCLLLNGEDLRYCCSAVFRPGLPRFGSGAGTSRAAASLTASRK